MRRSFIDLLLFILLLSSCLTHNENQVIIQRLTFRNKEDAPLEDIIYKSAKVVALETKEECLLQDIIEVRPFLSYLYVLDSADDLYVFDVTGKYINKIGKKGDGPNEYVKLSSFFINKTDHDVGIIDDVRNKINTYDLLGNYISSVSVSPSIKYCSSSIMTNQGDILLSYLINFGDNQAYSIMDGDDYNKNVYLKSYSPIEVKDYLYSFSSHAISEDNEGNISFIMPLCDTIFGYSGKKYFPKYVVELPNKMPGRDKFKTNTTDKGKTYSSLIFQYGNNGFFTGFTGIFETEKHILLKYKHNGIVSGVYLVDKESYIGDYYLCSIPKYPIRLPITNIVGSNNHEFIGVFNAKELIELYTDTKANSASNPLIKYEKIIETLDEESNPCLVFYSIE